MKNYIEKTFILFYLMSNSAVASAKNRRAGIKPTNPLENQVSKPTQQPSGLTLPQVIALIDTRLIKLEKFMNDKQEPMSYTNNPMNPIEEEIPSNMGEILEEFQQRFLVLAEEINLLKDTVLKLQSYTMDVNKVLLEERINILSDLGDNGDRFLLQPENNELITDSQIISKEE